MYASVSISNNTSIVNHLEKSIAKLSDTELIYTDQAVIMNVQNTAHLTPLLKDKALALRGQEDYVKNPEGISTEVVSGGHVSPL